MFLDSSWRWTHQAVETANCYTDSEWDTSVCPDGETCAKNCAVGAVPEAEWSGTYGVAQVGNVVSVGFVTQGPNSVNVGYRSHLIKSNTEFVSDAPEGDFLWG